MIQQVKVINFTTATKVRRRQKRREERKRVLTRVLHGIFVIPFATTIGLVVALAFSSWWNFDLELPSETGWILAAAAGLLVAGTAALLKVTADWWDDLAPCLNRRGELTTGADTFTIATVVAMMTIVALLLIDLWGPDWLADAMKGIALILLLAAAILTGVAALTRYVGPDIIYMIDVYRETHDLRAVWQAALYETADENEEDIDED